MDRRFHICTPRRTIVLLGITNTSALHIPFEPVIGGVSINVHLVLECIAFFVAFRYYLFLRKRAPDPITDENRRSIILGAIAGAFIGSRLIGYLENPYAVSDATALVHLLNAKSIMGGLFGGLIGVETAKRMIKEKQSSGDLFTFPLILGIGIGRVGCFLSGVKEFTYGTPTRFFTGMDLGDGLLRHPVAAYELVFLLLLAIALKQLKTFTATETGLQFKLFMLAYFGFRFFMEFLKPNVFYVAGLSSIQWLCLCCYIYYFKTLIRLVRYAR